MSDSPFAVRGVIEGFYGTYYTFPERNDLIQFMGRHGFNFYAYGPKNDRQHRMRWWDPYPSAILEEFGRTIEIARDSGVQFCYTISFGVPPNYATTDDLNVVLEKLQRFFDLGCRAFGVSLDDAPTGFAHDTNRSAFPSVAAAHADFCNRILEWEGSRSEPCSLLLTPTEYHAAPPFSDYLYDLGQRLDAEIDVCYTGRDVCVPTLTVDDVRAFAAAIDRKPLIWDNYPVNDLQMKPQLHLGPLEGRDPELFEAVRGMLFNPMTQAEASKIPLLTIAEYLRDPRCYDSESGWERALRDVAGERGYGPMRVFAENCLGSCLRAEEAPITDRLATSALASMCRGDSVEDSEAAAALSEHLDQIDEAMYQIRNRMPNMALRQNIMPWVDAMDERVWLARRALAVLRSMQQGEDVARAASWLTESLEEVRTNPRSVGGRQLKVLGEYVYSLAEDSAGSSAGSASQDAGEAALAADR